MTFRRARLSIAVTALLISACGRGTREANRERDSGNAALTATPTTTQSILLTAPKSVGQTGMPVDATRAAIPQDNPETPEKIALGEKLFFESDLSADGTISCSTCHDPAHAFTDGRRTSVGIKGLVGQRNAPTVLNALYNRNQFWDGRVKSLEEQVALSVTNPSEMGQPDMDAAAARIAKSGDYRKVFQRVFGRAINGDDVRRAIAAYERTQYSFDSPFDRFIAGDANAINDSAKRGWEIFNTRGKCNRCHAVSEKQRDPTFFTDFDFHNIGIGMDRHNVVALACRTGHLPNSRNTVDVDHAAIQSDMSALGRFLITKKESDIAAFKTPGLRNAIVTGPYFHDGSMDTLWDVLDHYNKGDGLHNPYLDEDIEPLGLTEDDIDDVVSFLASLTSPGYQGLGIDELSRQRELSSTNRPQRDSARAFGPKPIRQPPPRNCR